MKRIFILLWGLLLSAIVLSGIAIWLSQTTSGAKTTLSLVNSFAPVKIQYDILNGSLANLNLSGLTLETETIDIKASELSVMWNPVSAFLLDNINVENLKAKHVFIITKTQASQADSLIDLDLRLPIGLEIKSAEIDDLHIESLHKEAIKNLSLSARFTQEQWIIDELTFDHPELRADLSGEMMPYENFVHSIQANFESDQSGKGTVSANGDVKLSQLDFELPGKQITVTGKLTEWLSDPSLEFVADIDSPDIAGVAAKLHVSGNGNLHKGQIALNGIIDKQAIKVEALNYQRTDNEFNITSSGVLSQGPFSLKAVFSGEKLHQSELLWSPKLPIDALIIKSSTSQISGPWNKLAINIKVQGDIEKYPSQLILSGQLLEFKKLNIAPSNLSILNGQVNLSGTAMLEAPVEINLTGQVKGLNLTKLDPKFPKLDRGSFDVKWSQDKSRSQLSASFSDLESLVKNHVVLGNGQLQISNDEITKASMTLDAGKSNRIALDLIDPATQTLSVDTEINDLGIFINNASGSLSGKVQVAMKTALIDGQLQAKDLVIPEVVKIAELDLLAKTISNEQSVKINAQNLHMNDYMIKELDIGVRGSPEQHSLAIELRDSSERTLLTSGEGQWANNEYQLSLREMRSDSPELGLVSNQETMDVRYSKNSFILRPFCLSSEIAKLCGELNKTDSIVGQFDVIVQAAQNTTFGKQLGTANFVPKTETKIKAQFQIDDEQLTKLELEGSLAKLAIFNQDEESLDVDNISLTAIGENNRISINLNSDLAGGNLTLKGILNGPLDKASIDANIVSNLPDLASVSPLLFSTDIQEGNMQIEMHVRGELKAPRLSGFAKVNDTKVSIPELGITQLVNTEIVMNDIEHGKIIGSIISGEGKGSLKGEVEWVKEPVVNVVLEGDKLLIANTDSLSVNASPKLLLNYTPGQLKLTGNINIDRAFSTLASTGSSSQLSKDAIIIDEENFAVAKESEQLRNIDITTEFINPAKVEGYGVRGEVTGKLRITQKDSGPVLGNGQLEITGQYKAFGQVLQIESGRLNYVNTALDNPSLDFYASRKVGDVKVGVKVTGRPDALVSRLESTPTMREADILHYLVLGKAPGAASESESGQLAKAGVALALARSESGIQTVANKAGLSELTLTQELGGLALSLGKQLSPRLYIGYTMGFIEPINVARVRYLLSSKWVIESEISEETRAAIKYRFEKD